MKKQTTDWRIKLNQAIANGIERGKHGILDGVDPRPIVGCVSRLLKAQNQEIIKYATDWIEIMWNMDILDHNDWTGLDEAEASLHSYLRGNHKKLTNLKKKG